MFCERKQILLFWTLFICSGPESTWSELNRNTTVVKLQLLSRNKQCKEILKESNSVRFSRRKFVAFHLTACSIRFPSPCAVQTRLSTLSKFTTTRSRCLESSRLSQRVRARRFQTRAVHPHTYFQRNGSLPGRALGITWNFQGPSWESLIFPRTGPGSSGLETTPRAVLGTGRVSQGRSWKLHAISRVRPGNTSGLLETRKSSWESQGMDSPCTDL